MTNKLNIERGIISKILELHSVLEIKEESIPLSYFSGEHKNAFKYIQDQVMKNGEVPTVRAFKNKFPDYALETVKIDGKTKVGTEENIYYWCDELRKKVKFNMMAEIIESAYEILDSEEPDEDKCYSLIKTGVTTIENEVIQKDISDITENTLDRIEKYKTKKEHGGMLGIPTGFKQLDWFLKGLIPETLTICIANPSVGKTWVEVLIGAYAQLNNYRVLQFVTEMSEEQMRDRFEMALFSMTQGEISYSDFKSGSLSFKKEKAYFEFLENDLPKFEPLKLITATSPMGISAEIDNYKPDLVLIDGVYLMDDDQGADSDWLRIAHITRDLKKLCKRKHIPIFANSQADKNTSKKLGPELGNISYSQSLAQDSDVIISLFRDQAMREEKELMIKILKNREGTLGKTIINWDFDKMNFKEIYATTENEDMEMSLSDEEEEELNDSFVDL